MGTSSELKGHSDTIQTSDTDAVIEANIYPTWMSIWRESKMQLDLVIVSKNDSSCQNEVDNENVSDSGENEAKDNFVCGTYTARKRIGNE